MTPGTVEVVDNEVGPLTFEVETDGPPDGAPVLLLHGFPQRALMWRDLAADLAGRGLHTVAVTQRGYSPGARPVDVSAYRVGRLVADALAVLDALAIDRTDVVGHDWGAVVAWHLAARHPDRVGRLVAVSVPHPRALQAAVESDPEQQVRFGYIGLFRKPGKAEELLLAEDARRLRSMFTGSGLTEAELAEFVAPLLEPGAMTAALAWYRAASRRDAATCPPVQVPSLFVWGDQDPAIGRAAAEDCGEHVDGPYRFVPLAGIGHWVAEQDGAALAAAVAEHLA